MKKSKIEMAREIIARLQVEMNRPRLTESVRSALSVRPEAPLEKPVAVSARA
jgi:hypothetical protein